MNTRTHRFLRLLCLSISAGVLLAVGYYFLDRLVLRKQPSPTAPLLGGDVTRATRKVEYVETRQGRESFRILTGRTISRADGQTQLEAVKAVYYGKEGNRQDHIESLFCNFRENHSQVFFEGNVKLILTEGYTLQSTRMVYDRTTEIAAGEEEIFFSGPRVNGSGQGFELDMKTKRMTIRRNVAARYEPPEKAVPGGGPAEPFNIRAGEAVLDDSMQKAWFRNGIDIESDLSRLGGRELELTFNDKREVSSGECRGDARFQRRHQEQLFRLGAETLLFRLQPKSYALEEVWSRTKAILSYAPYQMEAGTLRITSRPAGGSYELQAEQSVTLNDPVNRRRLEGQRLNAVFRQDGTIEDLLSEGKARMSQENDRGQAALLGDKLRFFFRAENKSSVLNRIEGEGQCVFRGSDAKGTVGRNQVDRMTITMDPAGAFPVKSTGQGASVWIFTRNEPPEHTELSSDSYQLGFFAGTFDPSTVEAFGRVHVRRRTGGKPPVETWSQQLLARMSPDRHQDILELIQEKDCRMVDGDRRALAGRAEFRTGEVVLSGAPVLETPETRTTAKEFVYRSEDGLLTGKGLVETVYRARPGSAIRTPWLKSGSASQPVYLRAEEMELRRGAEPSAAAGAGGETVRLTGQEIVYRGSCRMVQGNNLLTARLFRWNPDTGSFHAEQEVGARLLVPQAGGKEAILDLQTAELVYSPEQRRLKLTGMVRSRAADGLLTADRLLAVFDEKGELQQIFAADNIRIRQENREARGDRALFDPAADRIVLTGNPAVAEDRREGRITRGLQLTFYRTDDKIRVENEVQTAFPDW